MKMWPPPAPPTSSGPLGSSAPPTHWGSSSTTAQENAAVLQLHQDPGAPSIQGIQGPRSSGSIPQAEG